MNKSTALALGAIIIIVGIGAYAIYGGKSPAEVAKGTTLASLLKSGTNQKCTFAYSDANSESNGTVYFANGKMRGDFENVVKAAGGKSMMSHMINDGAYSYMWSSEAPQGVKMQNVDGAPATQNESNQSVDWNQSYDYKCGSWSPDQALFALPSGITFMDLGGMMGGGMMNGGGSTGGVKPTGAAETLQCSQCNQIPDETAKAQCRKALGCKEPTPGQPINY